MKTSIVALMGAIIAVGSASSCLAVTDREAQVIELIVTGPDKVTYSFGRLNAFVRHMTTLGQACDVAPYEYGVDMSCAAPKQEPMVYLHFDAEPGPKPGIAYLTSLRINGRNGGESPPAQFLSQMTAFTHIAPKPADL